MYSSELVGRVGGEDKVAIGGGGRRRELDWTTVLNPACLCVDGRRHHATPFTGLGIQDVVSLLENVDTTRTSSEFRTCVMATMAEFYKTVA